MNTASASATGAASSVVKFSRPAFTLEATSASSPGSKIGNFATVKRGDLAFILVDAGDLMSEVRKAGA